MLRLSLLFFVISAIAALCGFGRFARATGTAVRVAFFIAIAVFVALLLAGLVCGTVLV